MGDSGPNGILISVLVGKSQNTENEGKLGLAKSDVLESCSVSNENIKVTKHKQNTDPKTKDRKSCKQREYQNFLKRIADEERKMNEYQARRYEDLTKQNSTNSSSFEEKAVEATANNNSFDFDVDEQLFQDEDLDLLT